MKKIIFNILLVTLFVSFLGCNRNDENPFLGKWTVTEIEQINNAKEIVQKFEIDFLENYKAIIVHDTLSIDTFDYAFTPDLIELTKVLQVINIDTLTGNLSVIFDFSITSISDNKIILTDEEWNSKTSIWQLDKK